MQILQVTLWIYATALKRSLECVSKNWIVSFAPVVYGIGLSIVGTLVAPFGIIGGFLYSLASAACASSALFLIKNTHMGGSDKFSLAAQRRADFFLNPALLVHHLERGA